MIIKIIEQVASSQQQQKYTQITQLSLYQKKYKSCNSTVFLKQLRNISQNSQKEPLLESSFNKVVGLQSLTLRKKILQRRCFAVNFSDFFWTTTVRTPRGNCCWRISTNYSYS